MMLINWVQHSTVISSHELSVIYNHIGHFLQDLRITKMIQAFTKEKEATEHRLSDLLARDSLNFHP